MISFFILFISFRISKRISFFMASIPVSDFSMLGLGAWPAAPSLFLTFPLSSKNLLRSLSACEKSDDPDRTGPSTLPDLEVLIDATLPDLDVLIGATGVAGGIGGGGVGAWVAVAMSMFSMDLFMASANMSASSGLEKLNP